MKIIMNRGFCDANLEFCSRCSAAFFRKPLGTDRPCIVSITDEEDLDHLEFVLLTDDRQLRFELTDELQDGLSIEGWEFLADFDPALTRKGAAERWRRIAKLPATHGDNP
jgi:hypothetical protein